jgi:hypothetical protein
MFDIGHMLNMQPSEVNRAAVLLPVCRGAENAEYQSGDLPDLGPLPTQREAHKRYAAAAGEY